MSLFTTADYQPLLDQIRARCALVPRFAILLGTGLGGLAERIEEVARIAYDSINGMPVPSAASHAGDIIFGHVAGQPVVAFSGRLHCYEGWSAAEVVAPVRIARLLGAEVLLMGSATGGMNPAHAPGDLVLVEDHINMMGVNPLIGPNDEALGPRWPDMIDTYSSSLRTLARAEALAAGIDLQRGVYVGVLGPNLETRAEYRLLRALGADIVGMSTVPEAIAAVHCGLKTLCIAIVTDQCLPDALEAADIATIIANAHRAEPVLSDLFARIIAAY